VVAEQGQRLQEQGERLDRLTRVVEEHGKRLEELTRVVEEHGKRLEEHSQRLDRLTRVVEEHGKRLEELTRVVEQHGFAIQRLSLAVENQGQALGALQRQVMGLGARWGLMSEEAFRSGIRSLFSAQPDVRVDQWRYHDTAGKLLGYPSDVEIDVVVRNGQHVLLEIKSAVSLFDVLGFARKAELYSEVTGVQADRRLIISPYVERRARELAARLGIEICEGVTPPEI
jgi:hypothetical protein